MPTTAPHRSTSGPPELPGLIGASVWIIGCSARPGRMRLRPLTIPRVIVCSRPIGLPIATTSSPTCSADESPRRAAGSGDVASSRSSARSVTVSTPSTRAGVFVPESSVTERDAAPSTTWALVSTWPSRSMTTPDPTTVSNRRWGFALLILVAWIDTTAGDTRSKSVASDSVQGCAMASGGIANTRRTTSTRITLDDTTAECEAGGIIDRCAPSFPSSSWPSCS